MRKISAVKARANHYRLIDEAAASHESVVIIGKQANAVLISKDDWRAIRETLYLLSMPGMRQSIQDGLDEPIEECSEELYP